ncbi:hypothetical protein [Natronorubrum texcoconense]|uniref:Uncharacterized protein n=1 Tax=Natronorubrum texcoconense TaxID=1095776 RepID=A0A1G8TDW9_9EURY|nr:hypothetical protein [Natronorubrum texcoconense]SDJ39708.1 hypothetical protein SAMN04515672_0430 [Natronorubrum texcoconense]
MLTPRPDTDGSPLSRRALLAASGALVSATAGCAGFLEDDDSRSNGDLVDDVPAETAVLAHLDVPAVADAGALETDEDVSDSDGDTADTDDDTISADDGANGANDDALEDDGSVDPGYVADLAAAVEARTGLDPLAANELLLFGDGDAELNETSLGDTESDDWERIDAVVDGDWSEDDVVDSLEATTDVAYEETTYAEESVLYEPETGGDDPYTPSLGVLGDDRFVVGDGAAVRSVLDVRYGESDPVSGLVRDAYEDARGAQLTVASETDGLSVPEMIELFVDLEFDILDEVDAVGRSYALVDAGLEFEIDLHVGDDGDAAELETVLRGALPYLGSIDEEFDEVRDDIDLERNGPVVTAAYEGEADAVLTLLSVLDGV